MSTRSTIYYSDSYGIHIFEDLLNNYVYVEFEKDDVVIRLMSRDEWEWNIENWKKMLTTDDRRPA